MKNQKIYLVTGAAGFIGSRFAQSCHEKKIETICVDHKKNFESRFGKGTERKNTPDFSKNIDLYSLFNFLNSQKKRPLSAIIHLGAITDTRTQDERLLEELNLKYSQDLWSYASQFQIPFLYASSAATYGDGSYGYSDDENKIPLLKPLNAYGNSKQSFDLWALNEEKKGVHPPLWSGYKFFNAYGFGENHKNFMSSAILHAFHQIQKTGKCLLFKSHRPEILDGFQKRDFIFIQDIIKTLHFALEKPVDRGIYNLGTGQARSFLDLAKATFNAMHTPEKIQFIDTPEEIRDKYQYFTEAPMEKLRSQGYTDPFFSLEEGISTYIHELLIHQSQKE